DGLEACAPADREIQTVKSSLSRRIQVKLYLNYSETVRSRWLSDIPGYIQKADVNWPEVQKQTTLKE
ncbi:MAG: hypothetical protein LV473_22050, partial [Nitrospira sp.]|nr:hypothetical protein [Nitrospira sp.]